MQGGELRPERRRLLAADLLRFAFLTEGRNYGTMEGWKDTPSVQGQASRLFLA